VGDEVLALDQDLAVGADSDGAIAALEGEILFGFDDELIGTVRCDSRQGNTDSTQDDPSTLSYRRDPDEDNVAFGYRDGSPGLKHVTRLDFATR
jgi:hypothetical protein